MRQIKKLVPDIATLPNVSEMLLLVRRSTAQRGGRSAYQVLLVSQIFEFYIGIGVFRFSSAFSVAPPVFIIAEQHVNDYRNHRQHVRTQDSTCPEWIQRRLFTLEELRSNNIGNAIRNEHHGVDRDFLSMSLYQNLQHVRLREFLGKSHRGYTYRRISSNQAKRYDIRSQVKIRDVHCCKTAMIACRR